MRPAARPPYQALIWPAALLAIVTIVVSSTMPGQSTLFIRLWKVSLCGRKNYRLRVESLDLGLEHWDMQSRAFNLCLAVR
jgi:hypothetical protein